MCLTTRLLHLCLQIGLSNCKIALVAFVLLLSYCRPKSLQHIHIANSFGNNWGFSAPQWLWLEPCRDSFKRGAANHDLRFYIWVSHLFSCTVYFGEGTSSNRSFVVSQSMRMYMRDMYSFAQCCIAINSRLCCNAYYRTVCNDLCVMIFTFCVKGFCLTEYCFDHFENLTSHLTPCQ